MKVFLISLACMFTFAQAFSQANVSYADKAAQIQKDVWGNAPAAFKTTVVPDNLSNEGAVVLARSFNLQRTSNGKFKFMIITAGSTTKTVKLKTYHERVKLNDKASLDAYSSLEYQKKLDKTVNLLFAKFADVHNTYIGVKIIKPNGKEIIVNTNEEVLLKNETKDQAGKLAIPGLEVGDILDYYISTYDESEKMDGDSFKDNDNLFILADEYPVLYYSIDFQFNKKIQVQYIYGNDAPHFEESTNDAGDQLFSLKLHNLPKYQNQLWTSPLRQYPYIEIGSQFGSRFNNTIMGAHKEDESLSRFDNLKEAYESSFIEGPGYDELEKKTKDYFKSNKAYKNAPLDSICKVMYDEYRYLVFDSYNADELENVNQMNYRSIKSDFLTRLVAMDLTDMKIDYSILLVASRNSNSLANVFNDDDFSYMIKINGDKPFYMCFDEPLTQFNEIPARFQGEKAVQLIPERHNARKYTFTEYSETLPVIPADQNVIDEQLQVSLLPDNMQKLKIDRTVKQGGALRLSNQRDLLATQTVDAGLQALVNGDPLEKRIKKMHDDYQHAFTKQIQGMDKNFIAEIKENFEQEPEHVEHCKIINPALEYTDPIFSFTESFVLNNLVKKAGDNYIIDAGKLTGSFYKLDDKDRKRNVDIYMPSARSFKYTITIAIPQGYTAKGLEAMTVTKTNRTGSFTSAATINGNALTITVYRVYNNNYETTASWPQVLELIDAASNFNTQKILLEKE